MSYSATGFPTSIDSATPPVGTDVTGTIDIASWYTFLYGALIALQNKVGVNSSAVTSSLDYKVNQKAAKGANTDITSLGGLTTPLSVAQGGTASTTASDARTALGVAIGTNVQAFDSTLTAFAAYNTNGLLTQTSADTFTGRTLTGTSNEITVSNGDGVSGNPTVSLPSAITLTGKTLTGGTLVKPILNGSAPAVTNDADGATITVDLSASDNHVLGALAGNRTIAISNATVGQKFTIDTFQDSTGSRTVTWFNASSQTVTMTIASPGVVTSGTDIPTTTPVVFTTTGALPTGITASTTYYWIRQSSTTGNVATTLANAQAGTAVNTSGSQSGTHTMVCKIRWSGGGTEPTLSTGKYRHDSFGFWYIATNVILGYIIGQNI